MPAKWLFLLLIFLPIQDHDNGISFDHSFDHVVDQANTTTFAQAPLERVERDDEAWSAGVADGPDGLLLGNVKDVVSWRDSLFFVLDDVSQTVVVLDRAGDMVDEVGQRGRGPGEFTEPVAIAVDIEGVLSVADRDRRVQRFRHRPSGYEYDTSYTLHFTPTVACALGEQIVFGGLDSDRHTLHMYGPEGTHQYSFGHHFAAEHPIKAITFSEISSVVCSEALETVVASFHYVPFVLAYSINGEPLWQSTLETFRPIPTREATSPDGRPEFRLLKPEDGSHIGTRLLLIDDQFALFQVRRIDRARDARNYDTYVFDLKTGSGAFQGQLSSRVMAFSNLHHLQYSASPFPRLTAYPLISD